ncbi:MAG: type II toxin-antitoxin system VapC family toxin [Haliscomenobacter sp.]|nr:type II toxin-antitoxin system VapC family toxin [Haliscomenobacter sp.]MBK8654941.1 type II toxin-antitoxin system VapC family toxin [Haliscomenobacter sp.]MBP9075409.1 type II toxin-antitoxin system VapC family toxin [Haliscomenobacter sp.]MBP9872709.1 type II toxin-antitoxin system VapC family toxin [Haliscomenobacter sp.]
MKILDSNIIIYASQPDFAFLRPLLIDPDSCASEITRLEVLGFHQFDEKASSWFVAVFSQIRLLPVDKAVIDKAISLRQQRKMGVGDAINAATALLHQAELHTRNTKDFAWIPALKLVNPILLH